MNNLPSLALHNEPIRCVIQRPGSYQIINQVIPSHIRIRTTQKLRHLSATNTGTLLTISLKQLHTKLGNISGTEINHRTQMRLSRPQILNRHILRITRGTQDRKSTRLNSSHVAISYAVFCLKKKKKRTTEHA